MSKWQPLLLVICISFLTACGQSGSLYLPAENAAAANQQG